MYETQWEKNTMWKYTIVRNVEYNTAEKWEKEREREEKTVAAHKKVGGKDNCWGKSW